MKHRFVNDGLTPIPMGTTADYACVCGRRGTHAALERHIAECAADEEPRASTDPYPSIIVEGDDFGGGDTKAHYLPVIPRAPASPASRDSDPSVAALPPPPSVRRTVCPLCTDGASIADLPEIAAWSCGHWIRKRSRPIAEAFQDMLRSAYEAGILSAESGEIFESWYQREVLQ